MGSRLISIRDLLKPELPIAAGICVVAGEIVVLGGMPTFSEFLQGFLVGFFISGSAMISNDYFDLEVDRINHPARPLPSGRISVRETVLLTVLFSVCGLVIAALLGLWPLIFASIIWSIGLLYNWRFKETGLAGNMMVSLSVASTFVFGGVVAGGLSSGLMWVFGALAFVFDLSEEISGGVMDAKGDELRSSQSIARTKGRDYALRFSGGLYVLYMALTIVPFMMGWLGPLYLAVALIADTMGAYFFLKLYRSNTPEAGRMRIRHLYLTMTGFVIAFIACTMIQ